MPSLINNEGNLKALMELHYGVFVGCHLRLEACGVNLFSDPHEGKESDSRTAKRKDATSAQRESRSSRGKVREEVVDLCKSVGVAKYKAESKTELLAIKFKPTVAVKSGEVDPEDQVPLRRRQLRKVDNASHVVVQTDGGTNTVELTLELTGRVQLADTKRKYTRVDIQASVTHIDEIKLQVAKASGLDMFPAMCSLRRTVAIDAMLPQDKIFTLSSLR
ncbi:hypothetical protein ACFX2J_006734 [Malus domestica]